VVYSNDKLESNADKASRYLDTVKLKVYLTLIFLLS